MERRKNSSTLAALRAASRDSDSFLPNLEIRTAHFRRSRPWISFSENWRWRKRKENPHFSLNFEVEWRWQLSKYDTTVSVNNYVFFVALGGWRFEMGNPFDTHPFVEFAYSMLPSLCWLDWTWKFTHYHTQHILSWILNHVQSYNATEPKL